MIIARPEDLSGCDLLVAPSVSIHFVSTSRIFRNGIPKSDLCRILLTCGESSFMVMTRSRRKHCRYLSCDPWLSSSPVGGRWRSIWVGAKIFSSRGRLFSHDTDCSKRLTPFDQRRCVVETRLLETHMDFLGDCSVLWCFDYVRRGVHSIAWCSSYW